MDKDLKWNIEIDRIKSPKIAKIAARYTTAKSQMQQRTYHHELYGLLAKNKSIHEWTLKKGKGRYFSEGSTQYILRKTLADTIQRVPDGELVTPYDKASKERIWLDYIFQNKVMWSEFKGIDMLSNLTNTYKMAFIYGFAPVRTGFEKDYDGDVRISYNLENWADVFINPDCKDVRSPEVVYFRQYMSKDDVLALLDENDNIKDSTYNEDTVKYVIEHDMFSGKQWESEKLADKMKNATALQSLTLITEYRRGADEFITFVPTCNAVFRTVPNYDPRKEIPWNFFVLETDPDFPLGVSQVEFLLADQQFNDLFQTSAYKNLLLAMEPPIMVAGWDTNPSSYVYEPRKIWNMGNNPNQVKVEPVKIDNSVLNGWSNTREAIAASMLRNLNVMDGTIAKDSGTTFSKTAPGVQAQQDAKTININQYQKRVELFVSQWANDALRSYIHAMKGVHEMTVDEQTRRKLFDIGAEDTINDNKIEIDFDLLSPESINFQVRAGSLVQLKEDQERQALAEISQPFVQNLNGWSDENRKVIENEVLLPIAKRMLELSDVDIAQTMADSLSTQIAKTLMRDMQNEINAQTQILENQEQRIMGLEDQMTQQPQQPLPEGMQPEGMANMAGAMGGGTSPSSAPMAPPPSETPGQQVLTEDDLLSI